MAVDSRMPFYLFLFIVLFGQVMGSGIEVKLIHRDSTVSPLYNQSVSPGERARDEALRSLYRANLMTADGEVTVDSLLHLGHGGAFLIQFSIGEPPVETYAFMDTASDLAWVQCAPCYRCFHQKTPLYDPKKSSTYRSIPCHGRSCDALLPRWKTCTNRSSECQYGYGYTDGSWSRGTLATETFAFQTVDQIGESFKGIVFGCGHDNKLQIPNGGSGTIGVGRGFFSIISQFVPTLEMKFSYCMPNSTEFSSSLKIGMNAGISGVKVVSTPLFFNENHPTYYFLNLEGITVGRKKIPNQQITPTTDNTIIDSGTMLNILQPELYDRVYYILKQAIGLQTVEDPKHIYKLCYDSKNFSKVPEQILVFHFTGADINLKKENTFISFDGITCFATAPAKPQLMMYNIYGNIAQTNFEVEYNFLTRAVSFAPANCSENPWKGAGGRADSYSIIVSVLCITLVLFMY